MDEFNIIVENEEPIDVTPDIQNDFLRGEKGPKGDPNTLTIGTVQKGEEANASIEGDAPNQVLNLTLPKGEKGDKPEKGIDYFTTEEKQEIVQDVVKEVNAFDIKIVEELPTEDIRTKVIYFVPKVDEEEQNVYDEYIYINNQWEHIGSTKVDLTDYYKKEETDEIIDNKAIVDKPIISGKTTQEGTPTPTNIVPIKNVNVYGVNKFDKSTIKEGYSINSSGAETSNTDVFYSDHIKVEGNKYIYISNRTTWSTIALYDANKIFIKRLSLDNASDKVLIPEGTYYIRINALMSEKDIIKVEKGEVATPYTPYEYGFLDLNLQKDTDIKTVTLISKILYENDSVDENKFHYNRKTIVLDGSETGWNAIEASSAGDNITTTKGVFCLFTTNNMLLTSHFKNNNLTTITNNTTAYNNLEDGCFNVRKGTLDRVYFRNSNLSTVEELKTWLSVQYTNGTPITIEYELAKEEDEPFNETNQMAWNTLEDLLINGYTFINSSSDELQPTITLTEHTANEIHRENIEKFKELEKKIALLESLVSQTNTTTE